MLYVYDSIKNCDNQDQLIYRTNAIMDFIYTIIDLDGNKKYFSAEEILDENKNVVYHHAVLEVFGFSESLNGNFIAFTSLGPVEYIVEGWDGFYSEILRKK